MALLRYRLNNFIKNFFIRIILSENAAEITQSCISSQSADFIVNTLHSILGDVITKTATRKKKSKEPSRCTGMKECDTSFRNYLNEICKDEADPNHISELYNVYQKKRKDMGSSKENVVPGVATDAIYGRVFVGYFLIFCS